MRQRKTVRLKHYDYSSDSVYFATICINQCVCLLGNIMNEQMVLNDAGWMVQKCYFELANRFLNVKCGVYIIMPNHFHCIVYIQNNNVGVGLCVDMQDRSQIVGADRCVDPQKTKQDIKR